MITVAFFRLYRRSRRRGVGHRSRGLLSAVSSKANEPSPSTGARAGQASYGTFAALPLFLLWVVRCWLIVLFGPSSPFARLLKGGSGTHPRRQTVRRCVGSRALLRGEGAAVDSMRFRELTACAGRAGECSAPPDRERAGGRVVMNGYAIPERKSTTPGHGGQLGVT